jgi:hypothetical protein
VLTALAAAAGIASSFVGNAVFVYPSSSEPSFKLRLDTGGYDGHGASPSTSRTKR